MLSSLGEALRLAVASLRSSVLRSALTLLGIILSTTTLIAVMSVIRGINVYVAQSATNMGSDGFRVVRVAFTGLQNQKQFFEALQKNPRLTPEEFDFIKDRLHFVRESGISATRPVSMAYNSEVVSAAPLMGLTSNAAVMSNTQIELGRNFTDAEDKRRSFVAVLGADLKNRFFPNLDPLGKTIMINGRPFEVIGTAQAKGSSLGESQDNFAAIPVGTYFKMYGDRAGVDYSFQALSREYVERAGDEVRVAIRSFRHLRPGQNDNFALLSYDSVSKLWDQLTGTIEAAAVGIVSVFMVVGGVVVMNIMLAVVSERTHEIGLRKSIGASRRDILWQFLMESAMLTAMGGVVGVVIAWLIAVSVRSYTAVPMEVPLLSVVIGVGLSTMVGLFFGIYPARRASLLDPITAMRAEK